jgi:hypothetical protein
MQTGLSFDDLQKIAKHDAKHTPAQDKDMDPLDLLASLGEGIADLDMGKLVEEAMNVCIHTHTHTQKERKSCNMSV